MSTLKVSTIAPLGTDATNTVSLQAGAKTSGFGKIGQVVNSSTDFNQTMSATSFVDLNSASGVVWETSITPSSTSAKILITGCIALNSYYNGGQDGRGSMKMFHKIGSGSYTETKYYQTSTGAYDYGSSGIWSKRDLPISTLLSPSTTSAVTIKFQMSLNHASANMVFNTDDSDSQITLMEVLP